MKRLIICSEDIHYKVMSKKNQEKLRSNSNKLGTLINPLADRQVTQLVYNDPFKSPHGLKSIFLAFNVLLFYDIDYSVVRCYEFLIDNYEVGDELYLFGAGRGGITVRILAGLISKMGLPNMHEVNRAGKIYRRYLGEKKAKAKPATSMQSSATSESEYAIPPIKFLGVWDSSSLSSIPFFPFQSTVKKIDISNIGELYVDQAFQALAVDEKRIIFQPELWTAQTTPLSARQKMEQVWFPGTLPDVNGGSPDTGLSDLSLQWMIEKATSAGLEFDQKRQSAEVKPDFKGPIYKVKEGIFYLLPNYFRQILAGADTNEVIDVSVFARMAVRPDYKPLNIISLDAEKLAPSRQRSWGQKVLQQEQQISDEIAELDLKTGHNKALHDWICALAVYPFIDWNLTIAIGNAFEKFQIDFAEPLVSYQNLLKIAQLGWVASGLPSPELRNQLLERIDDNVENEARKVLTGMLTQLADKLAPTAFIRNELLIAGDLNQYLINRSEGTESDPRLIMRMEQLLLDEQLDDFSKELFIAARDNKQADQERNWQLVNATERAVLGAKQLRNRYIRVFTLFTIPLLLLVWNLNRIQAKIFGKQEPVNIPLTIQISKQVMDNLNPATIAIDIKGKKTALYRKNDATDEYTYTLAKASDSLNEAKIAFLDKGNKIIATSTNFLLNRRSFQVSDNPPVNPWGNISFEFDSSVIEASSYPQLDAIVSMMRSTPGLAIEIDGYMSSERTAARNMQLSRDMANSVKTYLVNSGIKASRINVKAFGETNPIVDNSTAEGRKLNRMVQIKSLGTDNNSTKPGKSPSYIRSVDSVKR
jgi:outer membrane protein OmpA-like peptidoglycan-associated protein